jgi:threonine aldolase
MIDLRSDTVTRPTVPMRHAIANAPVGDDVLGDDPTVIELEAKVAAILGKEAAVFMPSGTMTNQVALRVHSEPGDEILIDGEAHIYYYEGGAPAALAGVSCRLLTGNRGVFTADDVRQHLRPLDAHFPPTKLVCVENTHNRGGGHVFPLQIINDIAVLCRENALKLHMDGARLWNACAATGISEADYAQAFDTVSVCFSKGLGAPVGSALVGSRMQMQRARRFRKQFGGAMRQAGIIAAGALYALDHHRERLSEDHAHAQFLAQGLSELEEIGIHPSTVETNIVIFKTLTCTAADFTKALAQKGVAVLATGPNSIRAVTHLMISEADIVHTIKAIKETLSH